MGKRTSYKADTRGRCPFVSEWSAGMPRGEPGEGRLLCAEGAQEGMRVVLFFKRGKDREEWKKRYCNCKYEDCPYYWIASGKYEE